MKDTLRWWPSLLAGVIWIFLAQLAQAWLSRFGILLYTDALLLILPALFFPLRPAIVTVAFCALFSDAARACPFGLSASLLLPSLLVLHAFQKKISKWRTPAWLSLALGMNVILTPLFFILCFFLNAPKISLPAVSFQIAGGVICSTIFLAVFGYWFFSLQLAMLHFSGTDLLKESAQRNG